MSEIDVKETRHNVLVLLLSDKPLTYASAVFKLAKTIDTDLLADEGLLILGYDFNNLDQKGGSLKKENQERSNENRSKILAAAEGSRSALSKIYPKLKGASWKKLYMWAAAGIMLAIILMKWIGRILTGTFF